MSIARTMTAICGTTLIASAPALAQVQDRDATDRQSWNERAAESLLNQLEGTWRVQVKIDNELMSKVRQTEGAMQRDRGVQQNEQTRDQQQREREEAQGQEGQRDTNRQPGQETTGANMVTCNGYAMNSMILDGSILQEHTIIELKPTAAGGDDREQAQNREQGAGAPGTFDNAMEAMSFFAFDPAAAEYSVVFMCDKMPGIHYDVGRYEVGSRRIVFNTMHRDHADRNPYDGDRQNQGQNRDDDQTRRDDSTDRQNPAMRQDQRPGQQHGAMHAGGGSQVVLELLGADSYRVTMYETPSPRLRNLATPRTDPTQPNRDQTDRDRTDRDQTERDQTDRTDARDRAGQPNRDQMINQPNGRIVYQATYQRLSSASDADARRLFEGIKQRISR